MFQEMQWQVTSDFWV